MQCKFLIILLWLCRFDRFLQADYDQELKKEVAVNDRMCPCAARWSVIANMMYSCMWAVNDRHAVASVGPLARSHVPHMSLQLH